MREEGAQKKVSVTVIAKWISIFFGMAIFVPAMLGQETSPSKSQDWSTIRGPAWNGKSLENGIAEHWPREGPPVLWTRQLGQGYSAFIAWDHFVATQYQDLAGQYVVCLSANTGATKWRYHYGWAYDPAGVYPGPRSTPVYDNGFVYFTSPTGLVGCLKADSGKLVWSIELERTFEVKVPGFGYSCSPIVLGNKILLPVGARDASMVALDKSTGFVHWKGVYPKPLESHVRSRNAESSASYCSAYPITFQGRSCVVATLQNVIAWHVAIANLSKRTESRNHLQRVQSIVALLFLVTTCLAYFLLCRRLSLLFEWAFLGGFLAAVPFNLLSKNLFRPCDTWTGDASFCGNDRTGWLSRNRWTKTWQFLLTGLGFSAFYWSSVAILYCR